MLVRLLLRDRRSDGFVVRAIRLFLWLVVGVLLGGIAVVSHAETIAVSTTAVSEALVITGYTYATMTGTLYSTSTAAVNAGCVANSGVGSTGYGVVEPSASAAGGYGCKNASGTITYASPQMIFYAHTSCVSPGVVSWTAMTCTTPAGVCPVGKNWTLSGTTCTRPDCAGFAVLQSDGTCAVNCPVGGAMYGGGGWVSGTGTMPSTVCKNGCQYNYDFGVQTSKLWSVHVGSFTGVGAVCTSSSSGTTEAISVTDSAEKKCLDAGQAYGTVNGAVVCVAASTTKANASSSSTTPGSKSDSSSVTTCTTDSCSSSTTTTVTNTSTGVSTSSTTTASESTSVYCAANPKAAICSGSIAGTVDEPAFSSPSDGKFEGKSDDVTAAETAITDELNTIKSEASNLLGKLSTGSGSMPCPDAIQVLGSSFRLCAANYQTQLAPIPQAIMLIGALAALFIIFR